MKVNIKQLLLVYLIELDLIQKKIARIYYNFHIDVRKLIAILFFIKL